MSAVAMINRAVFLIRTGRGPVGAVLQTMATKGFIQILAIGTGLMTARFMGPEGRGTMTAMMVWPQLLSFLSTLGIPNSVIYNTKLNPGERGAIVIASNIISAISGCLAVAIGAALMPFLLSSADAGNLRFAQFYLLLTPLLAIGLTLQASAETSGDFYGSNTLRGLPVIGTFIAICGLALVDKLTPQFAALAYGLPYVPVTVWLFFRVKHQAGPALVNLLATGRRLLLYGLRCYPIDLFGTMAGYVGQVLVVTTLNPTSVGLFTVSLSVSQLLEILYMPVAQVLLPTVAARAEMDIVVKTALAARLHLLLCLAASIPIIVVAPEALGLVYGHAFVQAAPVVRILLFRVILNGSAMILAQGFLALGRPGVPIAFHVMKLVLSVPLLLLLMPIWGEIGAAVGVTIVGMAGLVFILASYCAVLHVRIGVFWFRKEDFGILFGLLHR